MANSKTLAAANNDFTVSLYQALYPSVSEKNLIFSPFCLHAILGMVAQGAKGETRTEVLEGLKFKGCRDKNILKRYDSVISGFQEEASSSSNEFSLLLANRIYSQTGYGLNPDYVETLMTIFHADFEQLDFSTPAKCEAAAAKINKWVKVITQNKIEEVAKPGDFGSTTKLVLVNAIYLRAFWLHEFDPERTSKGKFHVTPKKQVQVDMMRICVQMGYGKIPQLNATAVEFPYEGDRLSMVIIVPKDVSGLAGIQDNIGSILEGGRSIVRELMDSNYLVDMRLPKFKVETTIENLKQVLEKIGFKSMFMESEADFGRIRNPNLGAGDSPGLHVSNVIQKAYIHVNEKGTEAAATVYMPKRTSCGGKIVTFKVDRPFYFQIVDNANGDLVIFSGHVNDPSMV